MTIPSVLKRLAPAMLCGAVLATTFSACTNVADIGTPVPGVTQPSTAATTTAAATTPTETDHQDSGTTTAVETNVTTATAPQTDLPSESRSPNMTYFVPASAAVSSSYFDDVVFVGDSVSLKLTNYQMSTACFGVNAAFLTSGSLGVANAMWDLDRADAVHPSYQGETVTVVDGIAKTGKKKVYLMLGINDLGLYGVDSTFDNFKTLTADILKKSPGVTLYIQSVTPLYKDYYGITNAKVNEYNALISEYCREKGWYFIDVASVLRDSNGCLKYEYCSDPDNMGIHFTDEGCRIWSEYLYTHTA